jgi:hypothetical protein
MQMDKGLFRSSMVKRSTLHKKLSIANTTNISKKKEEVQHDTFSRISGVDIITSIGDVPDSKAFFVCGLKDKKELFIYGGSDINNEVISHEVYFYDIKDNFFTFLSNISQIKLCLGLCSDLSGHSFEMLNFSGELKVFIFGGFNGKEYSNKCFLIDCGKFCFLLYII